MLGAQSLGLLEILLEVVEKDPSETVKVATLGVMWNLLANKDNCDRMGDPNALFIRVLLSVIEKHKG